MVKVISLPTMHPCAMPRTQSRQNLQICAIEQLDNPEGRAVTVDLQSANIWKEDELKINQSPPFNPLR